MPQLTDRFKEMKEREIAPGLLLAMPQLNDPNFVRAVVLMIYDLTNSEPVLVGERVYYDNQTLVDQITSSPNT